MFFQVSFVPDEYYRRWALNSTVTWFFNHFFVPRDCDVTLPVCHGVDNDETISHVEKILHKLRWRVLEKPKWRIHWQLKCKNDIKSKTMLTVNWKTRIEGSTIVFGKHELRKVVHFHKINGMNTGKGALNLSKFGKAFSYAIIQCTVC